MIGMGRMGKVIVKMLADAGHEVVAAVDAPESPTIGKNVSQLTGVEGVDIVVSSSGELSETLKASKPDVVVDFTVADACIENMKVVCENKINLVVGTTGFSDSQNNEMEKCIEDNSIGAVISPNYSVGVNAYWEVVSLATKILKGYDIEVVEAHHRFKKDAPSGTALKTAEVICDCLGKTLSEVAVYGREGETPRKKGEIGIHSIRAGDIVGDHTVLFSDLGERIEITHRAHSREAFASGVVKAVEFISDRSGSFSMRDVLGIN